MSEYHEPREELPDDQNPEAAAPEPKKTKPRRRPFSLKGAASNGLIAAFAVVVLFLIWSFLNRMLIDPPVEPEIVQGGKAHTIQLDVSNGSGTPKLGRRITDYLRSRGFDVVEMGNYKDSRVEQTRVIDRGGNLAAAQQVAEALGVPKERVTRQIDRTAYLDVSVIIGKDYRSLKPLQ